MTNAGLQLQCHCKGGRSPLAEPLQGLQIKGSIENKGGTPYNNLSALPPAGGREGGERNRTPYNGHRLRTQRPLQGCPAVRDSRPPNHPGRAKALSGARGRTRRGGKRAGTGSRGKCGASAEVRQCEQCARGEDSGNRQGWAQPICGALAGSRWQSNPGWLCDDCRAPRTPPGVMA